MSDIPLLRAPTPDNPNSVIPPAPRPATASPNLVAPASSPTPAPGSALSAYQKDAYAYLTALLTEYGLGSLSQWAYDQIVAGNSPDMVIQLLRETPEYKKRFHVLIERRAAGLAPMSEAEVISYEHNAHQMARRAGLPDGFVDQSLIDRWIVGDVSLTEANDRINTQRDYLYQTDPVTRSQLTLLYGEGNLLAHALDPTTALPLISRQLNAARVAASSIRSSYGQLTAQEADTLSQFGITPDAALQGFGDLASSRQLFGSLPGENVDEIGRATQLATLTGDAAARREIENRARARLAVFGGGGGYAGTQTGFTTGVQK